MFNNAALILTRLLIIFALVFVICPEAGRAKSAAAYELDELHDRLSTLGMQAARTSCDVGFVTDGGGVGDRGWNQSIYQGLLRAQLDYGVRVRVVESQSWQDYAPNLRQMVTAGCGLIVSVGFIMYQATEQVALEQPSAKFAIAGMNVNNGVPNLRGLTFDYYDAGYLAGALAGLMTQSNVVAFVGGVQIPPVVNSHTGYEAGAIAVNPAITRLGVYIPSFTDPDAGAQQAALFMTQGADVLFAAAGLTGAGATRYAAQNGAWVIGVEVDEYYTTFGSGSVPGASNLLSSALLRMDNAVYDTVVDYLEGGFSSGNILYDLSNDGVSLAPNHEAEPYVPQQIRDTLANIGYEQQVVTSVIPPQGGSIASLNGLIHVQFAEGAFPAPTEVFIRPQVGQTTGNLLGIGRYFELGFPNSGLSEAAYGALQVTTVEVTYRNHEIIGLTEASLGLYWWDGVRWVREQSSAVNTAANKVSAAPNRLGRFAILGERANPIYLPLLKIRAF